ncbi:zinc-ribbon domain-containing protein [Sphingomonas glacialis]|uniref:Zinc ribbon domain-containing protein n=1 Tax=Sphingomonas glacialis TaxID=658225 RepID=A0A502FF80_9SPHN|nr:zinc ribbon domain-containing protein [Sphingomonas glacialis]TPG48087.1 zinc ribbon domain-containing protein [Sphingomonas glacialis]
MYCDQCGQQIDDDSKFCRHCGALQKVAGTETVQTGRTRRIGPLDPSPAVEAKAKQKVGPGRIFWTILAVFVVLAIIGSLAKQSSPSVGTSEAANIMANADMIADNIDNAASAVDEGAGKPTGAADGPWAYSTTEDKVRGSTTYYARTTSTNTIHQNPPYDSDTSMGMAVRKSRSDGTNVVLTISSGQMMCPSYEGCSGTVSFDGGPAQRIRFAGPADHSSETIFVEGAKSFIAKLKKAKKVVIEKTLYEAGNPQFEFDVRGLKWDH